MENRATVAIVGRPNVGKSTLFNRLVGRRRAIVEDLPGVTRDRLYSEAEWRGRRFTVVDTGGLDPTATEPLAQQVRRQSERAIAEAHVVVLLLDGREGPTPIDREIVEQFRRAGRSVILGVNKIDGPRKIPEMFEFYALGIEPLIPFSAEQGFGLDDLMDEVIRRLPEPPEEEREALEEERAVPSVAVVGRPNVGKSTLINTLLGDERLVVNELPGTTRDSIDTLIRHRDRSYRFTDTAGIRRRGKIDRKVERYSVARALEAIRRSDVAVLLLDAVEGVVAQDTKIAGQILQDEKAMILAVNKWDLQPKDPEHRARFEKELRAQAPFLTHVPILFLSAKVREQARKIFGWIDRVYTAYTTRVTTGELNRVIGELIAARQPPASGGRPVKIYYATQPSIKPPTFVLFSNRAGAIGEGYRRYLQNHLRERFDLVGTPIRIQVRGKERRRPS